MFFANFPRLPILSSQPASPASSPMKIKISLILIIDLLGKVRDCREVGRRRAEGKEILFVRRVMNAEANFFLGEGGSEIFINFLSLFRSSEATMSERKGNQNLLQAREAAKLLKLNLI
jgi:hypothetical protein